MFKISSFLQNKEYKPFFIASCIFHVLLIGLLISNVSFVNIEKIKVTAPSTPIQPEIIKAVAVNQDLVQKEINRIDKIEQDKKIKEQQRQKKIQDELAKIKQLKEQEAKKVEAEKNRALELKKEQEELAKNALKIKKELALKEEEKKKLDKELLNKQAKKKQDDLLEKLKKAQEAELQESLSAEEDLIAESQQRRAFVQREIERYISLQQAKVSRNWISRDSFLGKSLVTKLEISLAEDGRVINVTVVQASGNPALDISAKNAILKASPLPLPSDGSLRRNFMRYRFTFRPDELTS